jgi:hypothetical protein
MLGVETKNLEQSLKLPVGKILDFSNLRLKYSEFSSLKSEEEEARLVALWRAVINQALIDLRSNSKKREAMKHYKNAKTWLTDYNIDFITACTLAQLDPHSIVNEAWKIIQEKDNNIKPNTRT